MTAHKPEDIIMATIKTEGGHTNGRDLGEDWHTMWGIRDDVAAEDYRRTDIAAKVRGARLTKSEALQYYLRHYWRPQLSWLLESDPEEGYVLAHLYFNHLVHGVGKRRVEKRLDDWFEITAKVLGLPEAGATTVLRAVVARRMKGLSVVGPLAQFVRQNRALIIQRRSETVGLSARTGVAVRSLNEVALLLGSPKPAGQIQKWRRPPTFAMASVSSMDPSLLRQRSRL